MKKGHPNPDRLDQTVEIIEAPSKVFLVSSLLTLGALTAWSFVAKIPATVPASAVFIQPYTVSTLKASGEGRFYFKSDLSHRTVSDLTNFVAEVDRELAKITKNPDQFTTQETIEQITNGINMFFKLSTETSLDSENNITTNITNDNKNCGICKALKRGEVYGFILNEQVALNFASNLSLFKQQELYSNIAMNANRGLMSQGNIVDQALVKRVKTLQELQRQGIVAESTVLQAKQQLLQQSQNNISQSLTFQSTKSNKNQQFSKLLGNIAATTRTIQLKTNDNVTILSKLIKSGSKVSTNQGLAIVSTGLNQPYIISCFIPGSSFSGVKVGDKVLVSPVNVDQNKYGSITGNIESTSPISLGPVDAQEIIGDPSVVKTLFSSEQNLFFTTIKLDKANTTSGYKWNSSNGPNFQIPKTTIANVEIITNTYKPYELVLPFLKSIGGS